jgi:multidrug efflux pump subunit AcrB
LKITFLSKISSEAARRYRVTLLFWVILLVAGWFSYTSFLKREGFPNINLPIAIIQGTYFVDNPNLVDDKVVLPISNIISEDESIESFQSSSGNNFFNFFVTFKEGTELDTGVKELDSRIKDDVLLPDAVELSVQSIDPVKFDNKYNLLLAVYNESSSDVKVLEQKATFIAGELSTLDEVEDASSIPVIETVVDPSTGMQISRQTRINKVGIRTQNGLKFYTAVNVGVAKADNVDDIQLSEAIKDSLVRLNTDPELKNVRTQITADFATIIDEQIDSLENNLYTGLLAVVIIAWILIGWRAALVIALFIPTVLATTFAGLNFLGYTLNVITLFAVILTLGLFVDDATIIVEATDANRKKNVSSLQVIKSAVSRVGLASIAGTLTTILVFSPMLYVSGILGEFITLLPITVILALGVSLIVSLLLVPFLARAIVLSGEKSFILDRLTLLAPLESKISIGLSKLPLININKPKKGRVITAGLVGISIVAIFVAGLLARNLKLDIFPQSKDSNVLQATVDFSSNTSIGEAQSITDKIDHNIIESVGEDLEYVTYVSANTQNAILEIGLSSFKKRELTSFQIIEKLESSTKDLDSAEIQYSQRDAGPPSEDFPFQMRIYSSDVNKLDRASEAIAEYIRGLTIEVRGRVDITRSERGRYETVLAKFSNEDLASASNINLEQRVKDEFSTDRLAELGLSEDALDFDVSQESENAESFSSIGIGLIVALILMYLLLVILFNSFSQPLLIFMAIPFSLFGVFFGLSVTDNSLSFFVMLGILGLFGIAVNNTILLIEYANQERKNGANRNQAISNAVKDRFRPLVVTTLTTVFALLPLAYSDPFWQPLAYTLIFGLLSSTLLIIMSFPYYYLLFERIRDWKNTKFPSLK